MEVPFLFKLDDWVKPKAKKVNNVMLFPKDYERFKITARGYFEHEHEGKLITAKSYEARFTNLQGQPMVGPVNEEDFELINKSLDEVLEIAKMEVVK